MTEEEREMLRGTHDLAVRINRALFELPPGSDKDAKPLMETIRIMARAYERGSWSVRALIWLLLTIAGLGTAFQQIREWWQ